MNNIIYLSSEPYFSEDVRAKSDPEEFIYEEEMSAYIDEHNYIPDEWSNEL